MALRPTIQVAGADPHELFRALGGAGELVAIAVATAASSATEARVSDPSLTASPILPKPPADVSS